MFGMTCFFARDMVAESAFLCCTLSDIASSIGGGGYTVDRLGHVFVGLPRFCEFDSAFHFSTLFLIMAHEAWVAC